MSVKEGVSECRAQQTLSWNLKVKHDRLLGQKLRQEPFLKNCLHIRVLLEKLKSYISRPEIWRGKKITPSENNTTPSLANVHRFERRLQLPFYTGI